jgi:hypothetical protein
MVAAPPLKERTTMKKKARTMAALGAVLFAMSVPSASHAASGVVRQPPLQFWEFRDRLPDGTEVVVENNGTLGQSRAR